MGPFQFPCMPRIPSPSLCRILIPVLSLAFFLPVACRQAGSGPREVLQYYPTGEVQRRHTEIDGQKEGEMTEYFKDGSVQMIRRFEDDLQAGKTTVYYPSGRLREVQYYVEGKLDGGDTLFYEDGSPEFIRTFDLGRLHGEIRKFGRDGRVIFEARYAHDTLVEANGQPIQRDSLTRDP